VIRLLVFTFVSTLTLYDVANACSCIIEDEWNSAKREYVAAEVVFKGYLITHQLQPIKYCNPYNVPTDENYAIGTFKVIQADKGVTNGEVIVANLGGVNGTRYVEDCELEQAGTSCTHEFYRPAYGTKSEPVWFVMNFHNGALWDNSIGCTAFRSNVEKIVDRYSKKDKR